MPDRRVRIKSRSLSGKYLLRAACCFHSTALRSINLISQSGYVLATLAHQNLFSVHMETAKGISRVLLFLRLRKGYFQNPHGQLQEPH
jgi:hypothetical protein